MSWNAQPVCDVCWDDEHDIRHPVRLTHPVPETCCYCGKPIRNGLYVRVDVTTVPYPTQETA